MRLILCRHAETVDNVAGLYAGVRDSALTVHGVEQARRLGEYLAAQGFQFAHIFASPLSRTVKTAEAILVAQEQPARADEDRVEIVRVPDLIEKSFGSYEGTSWSRKQPRRSDVDFVDMETKLAMAKRADRFLDEHLLPILYSEHANEMDVAIVSHGMLLSTLWKRILFRLPRESVTFAPDITNLRDHLVLEHLGGWSNTGYLALHLDKDNRKRHSADVGGKQRVCTDGASDTSCHTNSTPSSPQDAFGEWSISIQAVDNRQHLIGLKRQRGGIGRLAHDGKQKSLDQFFKRQRT